MSQPPLLVIGVGNRFRGDDSIGPMVVDAIAAEYGVNQHRTDQHRADQPGAKEHGADESGPNIETLIMAGDLSHLPLVWQGDQDVVIVDAMVSGADPGTVTAFNGLDTELLRADQGLSSHGFGLADAVLLARRLDRLPKSLTIVAVEAEDFDHLKPLSPAMQAAKDEIVERIRLRCG